MYDCSESVFEIKGTLRRAECSRECTPIWPVADARVSIQPRRVYGETALTDSTTFGLHGVTLESPMLNHSFPLRTNAVLHGKEPGELRADGETRENGDVLVPAAQIAVMICHAKQVVDIAVGRSAADRLTTIVVERRGQEGRQVEADERILHLRLELRIGHLSSAREVYFGYRGLDSPCR